MVVVASCVDALQQQGNWMFSIPTGEWLLACCQSDSGAAQYQEPEWTSQRPELNLIESLEQDKLLFTHSLHPVCLNLSRFTKIHMCKAVELAGVITAKGGFYQLLRQGDENLDNQHILPLINLLSCFSFKMFDVLCKLKF